MQEGNGGGTLDRTGGCRKRGKKKRTVEKRERGVL